MKQEYLDKLEYNEIRKILAKYCHTFIGKSFAEQLMPSSNKDTVQTTLTETKQAVDLTTRFGNSPISKVADINLDLKILDSSGILGIQSILNLTCVLNMAQELKNYFYQDDINQSDFNLLDTYFSVLYSNQGIINKVYKCIIDKTTIADDASSTLNSIRKKEES